MATRTTTVQQTKVSAETKALIRNIAIGITIIGLLGLAYALYLIIAQPWDSTLGTDKATQQRDARARGFNFLWISLLVIIVPWLFWWIFL